MKVVVPAAGKGTRLRPITLKTPKPLVRVLGKPLIEYTLDVLPDSVDEIIMIVGYKGNLLREHLGNSYKEIPIRYIEQKERRGIGHALYLCKEYIDEPFLFMQSDEIYDKGSVEKLAQRTAAALAFRPEHPENFGVFTVDDNMMLLDVEEKPKNPRSDITSAGSYKLTPEIFNHYPPPPHENGEYYLADMIPSYLTKQPMEVVEARRWLTVNRPEDIQKAEKILSAESSTH